MRVELMVSVLQTGAFPFRHPWKELCKAGFLPANPIRVNGFRFCRCETSQGAFAAPFAYPCSVSEAPATTVRAPEPLSARRSFHPIYPPPVG